MVVPVAGEKFQTPHKADNDPYCENRNKPRKK